MEDRGHTIIPSASLVPQNDPTTLFTGSGMQPLVPYLLGKDHPKGTRIADSQKCFRSMDIEEVGDNRHTTFFEMLGNWSLGDYFKKEQLPWFFEFLTDVVGLDPQRLYVTAFIGDEKNNIPKDIESAQIWKELFREKGIEATDVEIGSEEDGYRKGMQGGRIFFYEAKKNWWSRAGVPEKMPAGEPGGPDSEMFYEFTHIEHDPKWGEHCHPNCDCGRFLEIGNSVFMQYLKNADGTFSLLPKQNVDFGGGLERIAAASGDNPDVFTTSELAALIATMERMGGKKYEGDLTHAFRVIADHVRAATFLIGDGVLPGNSDQGYFVRRLIRRSVRYADKLGLPQMSLADLSVEVAENYKVAYPDLSEKSTSIASVFRDEEQKFRTTLANGLKVIEKITRGGTLSGEDAFVLFTTHGFPIELTEEIIKEQGGTVDRSAFEEAMVKHRDLSRAGAEQKFKGGLADTSIETTRLHTAHHLLLRALQQVLGPEVKQRGSNITAERLRIDFSYPEKMTDEQKAEVERIVNEKIAEALPVTMTMMSKEEAEKLNAEHEFGAKYPDTVSVYSIGPKGASDTDPKHRDAFSIEFCGGPHVTNTSELGHFKLLKEEAVAQGIRRIKAILE